MNSQRSPVRATAGLRSAAYAESLAQVPEKLAALFRKGARPGGANALRCDGVFNQWALRVHAFQRATNPALGRYWRAESSGWQRIPPLPVRAFRDLPLASGPAEAVFRTSGTTGGDARRGEHHLTNLEIYRAAARDNYRKHLLLPADPDLNRSSPLRLTLIALVARPRAAPDSSLSAMTGFIAEEPVIAARHWAFDLERGVDVRQVRRVSVQSRDPVLLITTAFALVQLLNALKENPLALPPGSRIMETGGFKGRVAEVDRTELYHRVGALLGVPVSHIVNEYGMTEMLSQAYDGVAGRGLPPDRRLHRFPPWVRTRALDPTDLSPRPPGEPGLLAHFDLANAASVCHILTEDLGFVTADGGVRLLGRASGADLRGCSLTAESFLRRVGPSRASRNSPSRRLHAT